MNKTLKAILFFAFAAHLSACGMRSIPLALNDVEATLAEVTNQYKRRLDLVPNLVQVVQGYAKHEQETLVAVTAARSSATKTTLNIATLDAESVRKFNEAQQGLTQALGKLIAISERYPDLKANEQFKDLQAQLEGTENRIAVARNRHIEAINSFNKLVSAPPQSWTNSLIYHHKKIDQWSVAESEKTNLDQPPAVKF